MPGRPCPAVEWRREWTKRRTDSFPEERAAAKCPAGCVNGRNIFHSHSHPTPFQAPPGPHPPAPPPPPPYFPSCTSFVTTRPRPPPPKSHQKCLCVCVWLIIHFACVYAGPGVCVSVLLCTYPISIRHAHQQPQFPIPFPPAPDLC